MQEITSTINIAKTIHNNILSCSSSPRIDFGYIISLKPCINSELVSRIQRRAIKNLHVVIYPIKTKRLPNIPRRTDFDVNDVDPETLTLGTSGVKTVGKKEKSLCSIEDVSGDFSAGPEGAPDGYLDLVCHFITMSIVPEDGDTEATLNGELFNGTPIEGTDFVNIVP